LFMLLIRKFIGLTGHKYTLELVERKPTLPDYQTIRCL
jgi:hypothetical protein